MRIAMRLLVLVALPGVVFGALVNAFANPSGCDADHLELLSWSSGPPNCVALDWTVLYWIAPALAAVVIAVGLSSALRPGRRAS
jgi:ABC-type enterochelin transport system permease subunit